MLVNKCRKKSGQRGTKSNDGRHQKRQQARIQKSSRNGHKSTTKHTQIGHLIRGTKKKTSTRGNPTYWQTLRSRLPKHRKNAPRKPDLSRSPLNSVSLAHCAPGYHTRRYLGIKKGFICRGTSRLLDVGVVVSAALRESPDDVLSPLLVSSSSHEWEEQLDEEPGDKSSLINSRGVENSANVAPKLQRSSAGG